MEFVDIAGIVKGASEGAGLGNKFLSNIRMTDAIVNVVRCFVDDDVIHVDGDVNPLRDIEVIALELIFADLAQIEKRLEKVRLSISITVVNANEISMAMIRRGKISALHQTSYPL